MGPLLVHPPAEDNYGTDACSILCLQTTPPVIVMATCEGKLHHCIVLNENNNTEPTSPSASELASSSVSKLTYINIFVDLLFFSDIDNTLN